jgi:hypothetical protein
MKSQKYMVQGLPEDTILVDFEGSAGQSFGAFATNGLSFKIHEIVMIKESLSEEINYQSPSYRNV